MESGGQEIISREQKVASYKRHRRAQRSAERALGSISLGEAINVGGPAEHIAKKDAHETAASIIKTDLKTE